MVLVVWGWEGLLAGRGQRQGQSPPQQRTARAGGETGGTHSWGVLPPGLTRGAPYPGSAWKQRVPGGNRGRRVLGADGGPGRPSHGFSFHSKLCCFSARSSQGFCHEGKTGPRPGTTWSHCLALTGPRKNQEDVCAAGPPEVPPSPPEDTHKDALCCFLCDAPSGFTLWVRVPFPSLPPCELPAELLESRKQLTCTG